MKTPTGALLTAVIVLALNSAAADAEPFLTIEDPRPFGLESIGFELPRDAEIQIDAVGLLPRYSDDLVVYAWILDSETRRPVWVMEEEDTDRVDRSRVLRRAERTVDLHAGRYELYFFTGLRSPSIHVDLSGLKGLQRKLDKELRHLRHYDWDDDDDDDDRYERRYEYEDRDDDRDDERRQYRYQREWEYDSDRDDDDDDDRYSRSRRDYERDRDDDWGDDRDDWDDDDIVIYHGGGKKRIWSSHGDWDVEELIEDYIEDCYVKISAEDLSGSSVRQFEVTGGLDDALIRHTGLGDSEFVKTGFRLSRPTDLRIVSVFEYPRKSDGPADFGWIVDATTRERVWHPRARDTRRAGGGRKNRRYDEQLQLPAGEYILYFGTDDSHSFEEWNVAPPWDPFNWGIAVLPGDDFDRSAFTITEAPERGKPLLRYDRAEDYDLFEQPFRLTRDGTLLIFALGEYDDSDDQFVDHGWIADANSGRPVWSMTHRNTMPGGGADKNRMFDGTVELEAGDYIAFYVTDDSHSYESWNSATPFLPKAWGMTVWAGPGTDAASFQLIDRDEVERDPEVLAQIVRVGDHERRRERFTLDRETRIHVYALGEGISGRMYDYGYIVDEDSGRTVWEMEYRDTRRAGGAKKNRLFDEVFRLPAGNYKAVYRTDGSHSFEDWNAAQPREPWNWGMTIRRVE
jgi:hypothetical protein